MKKEKKPLTIKQQQRRERIIQRSLFISEFVAIPIPYLIMTAVNWNEWIVYNPDPWKIGLGGGIAMALMSISVLLVTAKKENKEITSGYIALIVGWYAFAFVFMLLSSILMEIYKVMFIGGSGMLAAFGLDMGSKYYRKKADGHELAIKEAEKELDKEQAKEEMVKVRVKE